MHYLYRITDTLNNKFYIGQSNNTKRRWGAHKNYAKDENPPQYISRAMKKYGVENFEFEIIATCISQQDANVIEVQLIDQYNSRNNGYNIEFGGNSSLMSEETKEKMRIIAANRPEDYYDHFKGNQYALGMSHTEEWKEAARNRIRSEKEKQAISNGLKKAYANGTIINGMKGKEPWNKGIPMSESAKEHLSKIGMGRIPANKILFTDEQIKNIISDSRTCKEIGLDYGVGLHIIWNIKKKVGANQSIQEASKKNRILTDEQVISIKEEYFADPKRGKQTELAKKYNVNQQLINKLLNGKSYN